MTRNWCGFSDGQSWLFRRRSWSGNSPRWAVTAKHKSFPLRASRRTEIGFCLILHQTLSVPATCWEAERDRTLKLLQEPGYQKIGERPLEYAFGLDTDNPTIRKRFDELRAAVQAGGLDPYFVYMVWNVLSDFEAHSGEGFAAVSAYAHPSTEPVFAKYIEAFERQAWAQALAKQIPYVPLVSTGWDKRPRQDHPVSWEKNPRYAEQKTFPATATPEELAAHLMRAIAFLRENPSCVPSQYHHRVCMERAR
jgi:hypothetical protein